MPDCTAIVTLFAVAFHFCLEVSIAMGAARRPRQGAARDLD